MRATRVPLKLMLGIILLIPFEGGPGVAEVGGVEVAHYAFANTSGAGGSSFIGVMDSVTSSAPNACIGITAPTTQRRPKARATAPVWKYEGGCGYLSVSVDPLLSSATASGTFETTVVGTLNGATVTHASAVTISLVWTATSIANSDLTWRSQTSDHPMFVGAFAQLLRRADTVGSITSQLLGDLGGGSNVATIQTAASAGHWFYPPVT